MKIFIISLLTLCSVSVSAYSLTMPKSCIAKVRAEIGEEGSVQATTSEILKELKLNWKNNPDKETAVYDECGSSDFFYLEVKKETCEVSLSVGDSDGECY